MVRKIKIGVLQLLGRTGVLDRVAESGWRRQRLMILCYHGISLRDEHRWSPGLYLSPETFEQRLKALSDGNYKVLRLDEALERLRTGTLPPKATVITFDDGLYDFYRIAHPALRRYGFPSTVYFTTYYSELNRPIFRLICDYMLWQKRGSIIAKGVPDGEMDLRTPESREQAVNRLEQHAIQQGLSGRERDDLARELAARLGIDWEDIRRERILHLMTPEEAAQVAREGVDLQLHTHRHRTPRDKDLLLRELEDNGSRLKQLAGYEPRHLCYPSGVYYPEYPGWLREWGLASGVTCEMGLATAGQEAMLLPRLCDHNGLTAPEFEGWTSGVLSLLPHRS